MAYVNVTTEQGELIERINTNEYDLTKTVAREHLAREILEAVEQADGY